MIKTFAEWVKSPKKLYIFDFDYTLFNPPDKADAKYILNREVSNSYWSEEYSLEPPLVPVPAPIKMLNHEIAREFFNAKKDHNNLIIVLTGRPEKLNKQVKRILDDYKIHPDKLYLCTMTNTVLNKINIISDLLDEHTDVEEVHMFDDRGPKKAKLTEDPTENHIKEFKEFFKILNIFRRASNSPEIKIKINEVLALPPRE